MQKTNKCVDKSELFEKLKKVLAQEHRIVTVFMGQPENKLLNYFGQVDVAVALGCDCTDLKIEGDIPIVTPYEMLYSLHVSDSFEWVGDYPIGIERSKKYIDEAFELAN